MSDDVDQIEQHLEQLDEKSEQFFQKCQIRSAMRIAKEATRTAKSHSLSIHYMRGLFDQMRVGHGMLDPQATREASVELVLMLEDVEQARRIQPNLDEGHYHWLCSWMSACAYDNLAEATAMMSGCNSPGMHACINEGIQVCRQTGKMECVKCFREYASDVYMAADDFDMVRHQCQSLLDYRKEGTDNKDRRWSGHHKIAKIHLLEGRIEQALEELDAALKLSQAEGVYLKLRSQLLVAVTFDEANLLAGKPRFNWATVEKDLPEQGEWPQLELQRACCDALEAVLKKEFPTAIEILTEWDRRLTELNCLKEWFEVRLRLIAAYLLSDNRKRAEGLAKGLEASADESQDFLTLRRLQRLLEPDSTASPVAALNGMSIMVEETQPSAESTSESPTEEEESETPLGDLLVEYMQRIMESGDNDDARAELLQTFLSHNPQEIEDPQDASYLVHLSQFVVRGTEEALQVWPWAQGIIERFPDSPVTVSVVASLGNYFRLADPTAFELISVEQLEKWFRLSTSSKVVHAKNFARAASFFFDENDFGEAERCYSRAFRLDRTDSSIVIPLADLYHQSDRPRDGLAVLDLSLREGGDDPAIAWEAAMTALQLEQYDSVLTYIDKFFELDEPQLWSHYYKALAHLHLGQHEESLKELELEKEFDLPGTFHISVVQLCNLIALQRNDDAEAVFEEVLGTLLRSIDYLSLQGITRLLSQLWNSISDWPRDNTLRTRLEHSMLLAGLLTDEYFEELRLQTDEKDEIHFYQVHVHQQLSESWPDSVGCLHGQDEWTEYDMEWGVLAQSEEQAINFVLEYQSQCCELPAEIIEVQADENDYRERPGIVWQGMHWPQSDKNTAESSNE